MIHVEEQRLQYSYKKLARTFLEVRRKWHDIFKIGKEKDWQSQIPYTVKIRAFLFFFEKTFPVAGELRYFNTSQPDPKDSVKVILYT